MNTYSPEQESMLINLLGTAAFVFQEAGVSYYTDYQFNDHGELEFTFESDDFILSGTVDKNNVVIDIVEDPKYIGMSLKEVCQAFAI